MLGAAVADDVMGLVVLTVVVRLVTEGSVSLLSVLGIIAVAVLFLVLGSVVGLRVAPPLFAADRPRLAVHRARSSRSPSPSRSRSPSWPTWPSWPRSSGAFVAGIALSQADQSERIRRELTPVGHLFIPVFFLQIGIDADITVLRERRGAARRRHPPGGRRGREAAVAARGDRRARRQAADRAGHAASRRGRA